MIFLLIKKRIGNQPILLLKLNWTLELIDSLKKINSSESILFIRIWGNRDEAVEL